MFKKNKYKVLRGAISKELASFVYSYFLKKRQVARFLFDQKYISPFTEYWGVWNDEQVPNSLFSLFRYSNGNIIGKFKSQDGKRNRL